MAETLAEPPGKPPGERLASYFENFFRTVVAVATLGASLTFSKLVSSPIEPFHDYGYSGRQVQYLLASSWLLFVLALAFTSFIASALSLWRPQAVKAFGTSINEQRNKVLWWASGVTALLYGLLVAAFLTLALVVVAYVGPVGWIAFAFFIVFGLLGYGAIIWRSPIEWPKWIAFWKRTKQNVLENTLPVDDEKMTHEYEEEEKTQSNWISARSMPKGRRDDQREYGRSTSGDYAGGRYRQTQRDEDHYTNRYSKASMMRDEADFLGSYGHREVRMYDDGIREGLVVGEYGR